MRIVDIFRRFLSLIVYLAMLLDLPIPRSVRRLTIPFVVCVILTQLHFSYKYGYSCWTIDRN